MTSREAIHLLVDELPEQELPTVRRVLEALRATADPLLLALLRAPLDEESDRDDHDGLLSEARRQAEDGDVIGHEAIRERLGLT